ncbi:MAG: hypothetical protein KAQ64_01675 [Candidatus Pacebacteria bacterium]|nr:hypothetical protein [Candidatus Paceibacterota bacterium]
MNKKDRTLDIWMRECETMVCIGARDPWKGVNAMDKIGVDTTYRAIPKLAIFTTEMLGMTFKERRHFLAMRGKASGLGSEPSMIISGGIPMAISFDQGYQITADKITLGVLDRAFKSPNANPLTVNYRLAVEESLENTGEKLFREIHGYDLSNLLQMPLSEMQLVGRKAVGEKRAAPLNWECWVRARNGETKKLFRGADVPFEKANDGFVSSIRPSIHFPSRFAAVNRGLRGGGSGAANAIMLNDSTPTYLAKNGIVKLYIEGVEEFHDLLLERVSDVIKAAISRDEFCIGMCYCGRAVLAPIGEEMGLPRRVYAEDNLEGLDFHALIQGKGWLSGLDLKEEGYF